METKLTLQMARNMLLAAQGLTVQAHEPAQKGDVLNAIRRMNLLQIDTIHVIARSPYLVLWSRLGDYRPEWLDEVLAEKDLFEYWAHAMCFLPIEDFPLYRRWMLDAMQSKTWPMKWPVKWIEDNPQVVERVRSFLAQNGIARSAEFESNNHPPSGWWNWKDEKNALEAMLYTGELMIARRQNFQRVYTLRQNILPHWKDDDLPDSETVYRTFSLRSVKALGVARPEWVADYFRQPKKLLIKKLQEYAGQGLLRTVEIEGLGSAYIHPDHEGLLNQALSGRLDSTVTTLLSPFDPLVWDRQRARDLFHFDYTIECYTPQAKRVHGYFNLPILHRGQLVGRLDPKAHRKQGIFEVKSLHLEENIVPDADLVNSLVDTLKRLARWHETPEVVIQPSNSAELDRLLQSAL